MWHRTKTTPSYNLQCIVNTNAYTFIKGLLLKIKTKQGNFNRQSYNLLSEKTHANGNEFEIYIQRRRRQRKNNDEEMKEIEKFLNI